MAGVLGLDNMIIVKKTSTSIVFSDLPSESFFVYVVDNDDTTKYILSHSKFVYGNHPENFVINSNGLEFGVKNSSGTQLIEGGSDNYTFYMICFV